jgi:uncharacterized protein YbjT (DUF2867 family)
MIVITGATGNTGKVIAEKLQAAGEKVRVVGRSEERLKPLVAKGAEAFVTDITDVDLLTKAFAGATAAYAMIPPNMAAENMRAHQEAVSDALATAICQSGVKHVVALSSVGADKREKCGPVTGLHFFEEKLNGIAGLNVLHLRAGYFMENFLQYVKLIKSMGMTAGTLKADLPIAMIATRDIAAVAAELLRARNFTGTNTRELLGPRDYAMQEATSIIGAAIGKPKLSYSQLPAMMVKPAMTQMGLSKSMAEGLLEMMEAINSGWMRPLEPRSPANTTPTTFEQFVVDTFLPAFQG